MAIRPFYLLSVLLLPFAAIGLAHAAELGDARVLSYIGQPLAADVELTSVEEPSKPVQAHLARPDVYRGANIAMPPVLSGLDIAVIRQGGKQFLRLASVKPVESKHLHVYLELVDGGQRSVRLVTLWLTPDPNPAPPPAPVPVAALALAPVITPVPAPPAAEPAVPAAVAAQPAKAAKAAVPVHKPAPPKRLPVAVQPTANEDPAEDAAHATPTKPAVAAARPAVKPDAEAAKTTGSAAPAACAPASAPAAAESNACAVLGAKNEALRQELGHLEDKVKVLQVAAGVKSASEADAETVARANAKLDAKAQAKPDAKLDAKADAKADAGPKAAPRIHRKPKPAAPPEEPLPWLAIGGALAGLLALAGLFLVWRRRRAAAGKELRTAREPEVVVLPQDGGPAKPSLMAVLKARLAALRPRKRPAQAARTEPQAADDQPLAQPLTQPE
ncbi:hypothetical protein [Massilia brevitalea]|uniref:FimV/HubP-related protein n=1 Tax=Massilia brevitalea TaxID=442526 RepID=UPI002739033F|nr:hypothetical protein [Massilia brevitalea]